MAIDHIATWLRYFSIVGKIAIAPAKTTAKAKPTRALRTAQEDDAVHDAALPPVDMPDPIDALLAAHGLRRTAAARLVLGCLLANPDTSYTHAQLQTTLSETGGPALDRVTLYRLIDRLTQVGLLLCRVDVKRVRRYQAMPASVHAMPHFECQSCHRDSPLVGPLKAKGHDLERAAQSALATLEALGYQGLSVDFAVRGVCVDCANPAEQTAL